MASQFIYPQRIHVLRPSGKVIIENKIFDASTSGEYIDKNKNIEVVENEGSSIKVKQIT